MDLMDMRLDPTLAPQQSTVISHRQIVAVRLLQMPSQELVAAIARERDTNPALEASERETCHYCGAGLDAPGRACAACGRAPSLAERRHDDGDDVSGAYVGLGSAGDDDLSDPMLRVAAATGRGEGLLRLLCASLPADDAEIAEYLIGNLDHHGWLPPTIVEDAADALDRAESDVERVLLALQRMDPSGIGARGARECLLIQLLALRDAGDPHPLAETLVRDHLASLAFRRFR